VLFHVVLWQSDAPRKWYNSPVMSPLFDEVQKQAQMLTPQEKAALAHLLIEALDSPTDADVEQLWIAESRRRYEAYRRGELESLPGDEVMARARKRLT
jgi:putative addiction module component (TIGR02574 family)